jgi:hypothetical protein
VLALFTAVFILAGALPQMPDLFATLLNDAGFALLVAILVYWVERLFQVGEPTVHSYASNEAEYRKAFKDAEYRVWIHNTWLARTDTEANKILATEAKDIRLLVASFRRDSNDPNGYCSFVYARIAGRGWKTDAAKSNVCSTVQPFVKHGKAVPDHLRFTFGHHPGWIAVLDNRVFWGPTPVDQDNQAQDIFFNAASRNEPDVEATRGNRDDAGERISR